MRSVVVLALTLVLTSTAGAATAPDALVIGLHGEVYLVDAAGTATSSLDGFTASAAWSPDGTRLAFLREVGARRGLFVAAADGTGAREIARSSENDAWGAVLWVSPDEVVLFGSAGMRVVPVDGGPVRLLAEGANHNFPFGLQPGGSLLAYGTAATYRWAVVDVRTGASQLLPVTSAELAWSPDGALLALPVADGIDVIRPDGTGRRALLPARAIRGEAHIQWLRWAPDGRRVAFTRYELFPQLRDRYGTPARTEIYSVGADGSGLTRLTGVAGDDLFAGGSAGSFLASWRPDGSGLIFRRGAEGPFMTMNADGSCESPWRGPFGLAGPIWRPGAAVASGSIECSSVIVRLRTPLAEVAHRDVLPLTVAVRNDGTRVLRDLRLSLDATHGTLTVPGWTCGTGGRVVCALGDVEPGSEILLRAQASFSAPGGTKITAAASYGGGDLDPSDDIASVQPIVSPCDLLGTRAADRLIGTARRELICGAPGWDYIDARGGDDIILAGSGADTVVAGTGRDVVDSGGGGDTIRVRDGQRDVVDCGTETDIVVADRKDVVRRCERVRRR